MLAIKAKKSSTLANCIDLVTKKMQKAKIYFGHGTNNAMDEAVCLIFYVLKIEYENFTDDLLQKIVPAQKILEINALLKKRIEEKIPLPYLTSTAYFAGLKFYVDKRVIIPRSPFAEFIQNRFAPWIAEDLVCDILDLCTGSACMAIACAKEFVTAHVTAVDISEDALNVAKINVQKHHVATQVTLLHGDLFAPVKNKKYDVIISNPPYVSKEEMQTIPSEYIHEPNISLEAADCGLALVLQILHQAKNYLRPHGILVVEVGNAKEELQKRFKKAPFIWLEFERGGGGVFLLTYKDLVIVHGYILMNRKFVRMRQF